MAFNEQATGPFNIGKYFSAASLKKDFPASIVVFLVALPLCLGIALASGAPLFSGVLTGIIGGIVVGAASGSQLSVSGPAAGLTVIVFGAIAKLGSYETFLLAIVIAGAIQIILGVVKAGTIASYFPSAVIEGMLAAIGIILILKQIPHAVGFDADFEGDQNFVQDGENTFSAIGIALRRISLGALSISSLSLLTLIYWPKIKKLSLVPAPLVVVLIGVSLNITFSGSSFGLRSDQLVLIPVVNSLTEFVDLFRTPDFSQLNNKEVWTVGVTIAIVASLESLLSLEAVDKIDPIKRTSPTNRELVAQGAGNIASGLLGGLPMTAVIVRSSANVNAGARTKMSAIIHGFLLLASLLLFPFVINLIPLSCLAAILLFTGYKLSNLALFKKMWSRGRDQYIPFFVTVSAVVFTDLLTGVGIGMAVGVFFILRTNLRNPYFYTIAEEGDITLRLAEEVSFLNKAAIQYALTHLPSESTVVIDGKYSRYIDQDVLEVIHNFKQNASINSIEVRLENIKEHYTVPPLKEMIYKSEKFN